MSVVRNKKREINYQTTYRKVSVRKIMRTVNIKGESTVNGGKCTMERISPWPHTVTDVLIQSGWPVSSSRIHPPPIRIEV